MKLVIVDGAAAGRVVDVAAGDVVVGREEGCDIVLTDDDQVSRRHCRFSQQDDGTVQVVDLGSSNGTFVDGQRITEPTTLRGGEAVRIGRTLARVERDPTATIAASPGTIVAPAVPPPPAATQPLPAATQPLPPAQPVAAYSPPPPPPRQGPPPGQSSWKWKWPLLALAAAVLIAGGVVGGVLATRGGGDPETVAVTATETTESTVTVQETVVQTVADTGEVFPPDTGAVDDTTVTTPIGAELLAHVPADIQATCDELDPTAGFVGELDGAIAAVGCSPQDGTIDAIYIEFDSVDSMNAAYAAQIGDVQRDSGSCGTDATAEGSYTTGGDSAPAGRVLCYEADGQIYWWTSDATSILAVASGPDLATVADFWTGAGPVGSS